MTDNQSFSLRPVQKFASIKDAYEWMEQEVDDECIDNHRYYFHDNGENSEAYDDAVENGCCGSFDTDVIIDGRKATIGCDYGH